MKKFLNKRKKQISQEDVVNMFIYGTTKPSKDQQVKNWKEYDEIPLDKILGEEKNININIKNENAESKLNLNDFDTKGKNLKMKNVFDISHLNKEAVNVTQIKEKNKIEDELIPDGSGGFLNREKRELLRSQSDKADESSKSLKSTKPKIHPKQLPYQKLEVIYSHDTIQLMESFKLIEYKKNNINKLIDMLAVIRKKKDLKIYDFPEITNAINFIKNNLSSLSHSYLISFVYSLSKMQSMDEEKPSLDNQNLVYESIAQISEKIDSIDIRGISNFVYALQIFQNKNPQVYNFSEFFNKLEEKIILKIAKYKKNLTSQDITNIILAYSKTQNGSEEFYRIIQEIVISMKDHLKTQDMAVVIYSYSNNPNCNEKILEVLEDTVKSTINKFLPKELCSVLRGYHNRKLLSEDLKKKIIEAFIEKHEFTNATDLAYFYSILADEKETRFLKFSRKGVLNLSFNFNGLELAAIFEKAEFIQKNDPEMYKVLQRRVEKLIKDKSINGHDLKKIYLSVKEIPFEGKYNTFVEAIERHLEKIRYF
jgi:hypothetical protein